MADAPITIRSLTLIGFRAYLASKLFDFSKKPSLAVFAPNGMGKSGLVDALEFLFSKDGTIKRLGLRAVNNQAGVTALAHDLAAEKSKPSEVRFELNQDTKLYEGSRSTSGERTRPAEVEGLVACLKVDPIIRGYALRHFVENQTPEERYAEVAQWLQLMPLVEVQRNLRLLRQQVKADAEDDAPKVLIDAQISKATSKAVTAWDEKAVLAFANGVLRDLCIGREKREQKRYFAAAA
jgi:DNA repair exonuclease SbcCD ATPase subunit